MKQRDFGWLAEVKKPEYVDPALLAHCHTAQDAILLTWNMRKIKYSQADASAKLEMPKSHLSNILAGKKYLPEDLRIPFMFLCGNLAMRQYEDAQMEKIGLNFELMEAERRVEEIKARRAA